MAVDSVTPTLFVISEGGDLLRWLVLNLDFVSQASDIFQFFLILCMQVWLCWLHEGAKRHSGGGKGVLCLWFQGYFPSMYMAVASEKLPKYPTKDKIVPPGPQCGGIHRGRGLREADRVSGEGGVWTPWMYESHTNCWGEGNLCFSSQWTFRCESITNFPNGIDISDAGDILIGDSHGNRCLLGHNFFLWTILLSLAIWWFNICPLQWNTCSFLN